MNSEGFKAWLKTTDDRHPLSNYMTVLEGTAEMWEKVEVELAQLREDCAPFHAQIVQRKTYKTTELPRDHGLGCLCVLCRSYGDEDV